MATLDEIKRTNEARPLSIKDRASNVRFNTPLADSSQDYTISSVENAYTIGAEDQKAIDKLDAADAFCKIFCPYEQCEVKLCGKVKKFIDLLSR